MPELPEVETIKRSLQKDIVGKTITDVVINKQKLFRGDPKDVIGKKILGIKRIGKMFLIDLEGELSLLIHLKMSGQLIWNNYLPGKTTHVIIKTDDGTLFFNDLRQFGWIRVIEAGSWKREVGKLGPEPFTKEFTTEYLKKIFSKTSKAIKLVLLDQEKISGIGNIYANDALFEAGILPTRPAKSLTVKEINNLKEGIIKVLEDGIKYGGSSAGDEAYIKPDGTKGNYQDHARVYQKDGETCPRCGGIIRRINIAGRGTFFCPKCQH
ncbi:formamidopyrimidine-DNA glycosylase [Candidatus Shapirobacteria bacterium CG08_land_8_20_14_0_20_39_18]|uniref:Formamidopyrimidine-DNA glycosylase n=1 Tax=Candidatus Shapirobacteria bacterium CG08_land_8_20_14_0_20_39_18 TaxID=1974883 RepID=A0A2M6XD33_9BACT|nr:MAG: formamidopyrimidine-DNA glycosylase [Candidatus Shapirobacteria bacterium CG08_land_8_20_14_0_20_39_18]PIY65606.1 MAG: formamidopyrimidine-DNA glycosylase [Candidatus Shapirobacteria bacterium CG_4_10_14_0_8_um_filter_39_15]PJE68080.1 MAG: formamidopyrimidine-DNA glycosylase [Candidatus Shapirobacteria bacterium CG10_big_fil_rev_8_21_14_0_10_38_8]